MGFGNHFSAVKGNEFFCEIDYHFLEKHLDEELLAYGIDESSYLNQVQYLYDASEEILQFECQCEKYCEGECYHRQRKRMSENHVCSRDMDEVREYTYSKHAGILYGLLHSRYIMTDEGMEKMKQKYQKGEFGYCPRVYCENQPLLPLGLSDIRKKATVKMYCPKCEDLFHPRSTRFYEVDGAYFGTGFPHMFLMANPELRPKPSKLAYIPMLYGFRLHSEAIELQREKAEIHNKAVQAKKEQEEKEKKEKKEQLKKEKEDREKAEKERVEKEEKERKEKEEKERVEKEEKERKENEEKERAEKEGKEIAEKKKKCENEKNQNDEGEDKLQMEEKKDEEVQEENKKADENVDKKDQIQQENLSERTQEKMEEDAENITEQNKEENNQKVDEPFEEEKKDSKTEQKKDEGDKEQKEINSVKNEEGDGNINKDDKSSCSKPAQNEPRQSEKQEDNIKPEKLVQEKEGSSSSKFRRRTNEEELKAEEPPTKTQKQ